MIWGGPHCLVLALETLVINHVLNGFGSVFREEEALCHMPPF